LFPFPISHYTTLSTKHPLCTMSVRKSAKGHANGNPVTTDADWWRQATVYQIYPRSFADENGDGMGDLKGITARVPYLKELGIDAVWLSPFYPSALKDGGCEYQYCRVADVWALTMGCR
jgi:alpha-glucosidase